ncbi:outer membrane beta-barrel protein [Flavobacterium humi]|uniref:Outer membrane protein beta-barrel domain-containing protein n=1 Tax=Flavobacterium humi TaxID=2562683 RepID=A0A4Z0L731_9FLAO|nr:outer membrane beta-barrel protein [Flavobacterium humi]TGD57589.1 hypothetical protein E4635_10385 [Flavobacterium humi]
MSERKNIERLFQEKFKDFEAAPPPQVWAGIESKLEKKESKPTAAVPFWLKASGIAAVLLLGYFTADNYSKVAHYFNTDAKQPETVVSAGSSNTGNAQGDTTNNNKEGNIGNGNTANGNLQENPIAGQEDAVVLHDNTTGNEKPSLLNPGQTHNASQESVVSSAQSNNRAAIPTGKNRKSEQSRFKNQDNTTLQHDQDIAVAATSQAKKEGGKKSNNSDKATELALSGDNQRDHQKQSIAENNTGEQGQEVRDGIAAKDKNRTETAQNKSRMAKLSEEIIKKAGVANGMAITEGKNSSAANASNQTRNPDKNISLFNEGKNASAFNTANPAFSTTVKTVKDSAIIAAAENPLEKILKEKENKDKEEKKVAANSTKWKIRPNVGPVYMSASKGSPIDGQFGDNAKEYEKNISIGLGVDYAVTSKIALRTGISKLDLGYHTNGIVYYEDLNSRGTNSIILRNINLRPEASRMVVEDRDMPASQELAFQDKEEGYLSQQMDYMEVPVEVSYTLIDKKFGLQLITGLSTLFLSGNEVSVVSNGFSTTLGEANNLNKVHFSTNIGLGVKYSFWKSFEANFEPTFKYQINTFNENSGGFKPYVIGLYTGISFRF